MLPHWRFVRILVAFTFTFLFMVCSECESDATERESEARAEHPIRRRLGAQREKEHASTHEEHNELLRPNEDVHVLGPTIFPKPTDVAPDLAPRLKPAIGKHRRDRDAVIAYAAEYKLDNYVVFIESLRKTGYEDDVVLSVSELDLRNAEIREYLSSTPGVVVYVPQQECFNFEGESAESAKGGMRPCLCHGLYGKKEPNGTVSPAEDPRPPRTLATARYEVYWLMILNYDPDSWILVVDARDTYFQSDPFADVPRRTDPLGESGLLYYFGENMEATRLGQSKQNAKWLSTAYGDTVGSALAEKPTICSGATMGEQIAMESYVRAMVAESDSTGTVLMGADQGFHNFLYYSQKLQNSFRIHDIVVFDQGTGIVNNMGALRTKALGEWGNGKIVKEDVDEHGRKRYQVLNWDGILSPVVHQFDRHKELTSYFFKERGGTFISEWRARKA